MLRAALKDIDFDQALLFVRSGKGNKDRSAPLADAVRDELRNPARSPLDIVRARTDR